MTIPVPIYIKLTNVQKHCMQMSYTKFDQIWAINVGKTVRNTFIPVSRVWPLLHQVLQNSMLLKSFMEIP